jgi:glycosyltransferase involved in cell wall biosynthesis
MQPNAAPKVAVIMPAYNASEFIESSVRSILSQSFCDMELIVVNDGSKDNTGELLAALAAEDKRLRPVTVENGGPAMARNHGLDLVQPGTEYIMFADSDDELAPGAIAYAVEKMAGADLALLGFTIRNADGSEANYFEPEEYLTAENVRSFFEAVIADCAAGNMVQTDGFHEGAVVDTPARYSLYYPVEMDLVEEGLYFTIYADSENCMAWMEETGIRDYVTEHRGQLG